MDEHILGTPEDIGKAEALALVEPLHPRRLQGQGKNIGADHLGRVFAKRQDHAFRRVYAQDFNSLNAALRALDADFDARAITVYEHNTLEVKDGAIWINGQQTNTYTFQQDYYWMMGDNRHRSQDARFWGFVPYDHVVGKAVLVWLTADPEKGGFPMGIRWKRLFSRVR